MPQIPSVTINQTIINKTQFDGEENELTFELVEFGILVWNPRDNIMQTFGYGNKNLDLSVISMKIIFNTLEMGKTWISFQKPQHLRGNWRRKFSEVTLEGRVKEKKNAVCCCFNNHNKYFCASSNMYVSYGIYFVLIIDSHKNKI